MPNLDFVFNFASSQDVNHFGASICGYYKHINLNKKMLYDEFGKLLDEFSTISIQFRIYPVRE